MKTRELPASVDLRRHSSSPYDQGVIGCGVAHAIAAAIRYSLARDNQPPFSPSRLFLYYNQRMLTAQEHFVSLEALGDSGGSVRNGFKSVSLFKVCAEDLWPYDPSRLDKKPHMDCYLQAERLSSFVYVALNNSLQELRSCLANGTPIVFAFATFTSFISDDVASTGILFMPEPGEPLLGSHAALAVGYDDDKRYLLVQNSWGEDWGQAGYFFMPYDYLLKFGSDLYTITSLRFAH